MPIGQVECVDITDVYITDVCIDGRKGEGVKQEVCDATRGGGGTFAGLQGID